MYLYKLANLERYIFFLIFVKLECYDTREKTPN